MLEQGRECRQICVLSDPDDKQRIKRRAVQPKLLAVCAIDLERRLIRRRLAC